ncbi:MEDS domain-containing protein [Halobacteria archaeon AArc-m2/3/4]|uniref:histidine kinase n=1 Tax=Natronoglomus mannanivorans TaxID=2979990 RepID=A0ABT2QCY4_9EURY|nr:MEDS domain-containing protein [Halobacteria archaeon AArc-m2/3/4]
MSQDAGPSPQHDSLEERVEDAEPLSVESGLEALRSSSEFRGPVEPLDDVEANEHIALFYESREEQFSAVVPFVRQGLERGERVMYVLEEHEEDEVIAALSEAGIDVDTAVDSGALTFHGIDETYLRTGAFDPDEMLEFYGEALAAATAEYPALRITADTRWILDDQTTIEDFMAYESRVNDLFRGEDCIALCQYDREAFPSAVLTDIVRTHPHLIYDGTLCHNFYYTPPREYFEPDEPTRDVNRMLGTLVDRTEAKVELNETIEELAESNERLKRFAYIASHDLQEPLRMISSYLQLLENRYGEDLDDEAEEYIDFAVDGADRMREMVDGLLEYSRIDMQDADFEPVDCDAVLEDVVTDLQLRIEESDAAIVVEELPAVVGDANQLEQLFSNLVSNAIKYSGEGPPRVEVSAERQGDRAVFSVADNGIGIESEYVDQIFEVFNRLHSNDEYRGTGIGLALCRKIVRHHGGDIWVDSELGAGTTFYFTLPRATA